MPTANDVASYLSQHRIEVLRFSERTPDAVSQAAAVGCSVAEVAKSILLTVGDSSVLIITCGDTKFNSSKLKKAAGLSGKVRLAAAETVEPLTGYAPGGVTPFLLPKELPVLLDTSMRQFDRVYPAAGNDYSAAPVTFEQLLELTGGKEAEICS